MVMDFKVDISKDDMERFLLSSISSNSFYTTFPLDLKSSNKTFLRYSKKVEKYLIFQLKKLFESQYKHHNTKFRYWFIIGLILRELNYCYKDRVEDTFKLLNGKKDGKDLHRYLRFTNLLLEYPRLQLCNIQWKHLRKFYLIRSICESNKEFWKFNNR